MVDVQVVIRNRAGDKKVVIKGFVSELRNTFVEEVEGLQTQLKGLQHVLSTSLYRLRNIFKLPVAKT